MKIKTTTAVINNEPKCFSVAEGNLARGITLNLVQ